MILKGNLLLVLLAAALLALSLSGCMTVTKKGEEAPTPPSSAEPAPTATPSVNSDDLYNDTETKNAIQSAVEALIDDKYKGSSYSCDVDVRDDENGVRYVVNIQINVDVVQPESTEIIQALEDAISALGDDRIGGIDIMAFKETQKEICLVDSNLDLDPSLYKIPAE